MERAYDKKMKRTHMRTPALVAIVWATYSMSACSPAEAPQPSEALEAHPAPVHQLPSDPAEAVAQAREKFDRSSKLGFAWRPARQALAQAEAAFSEGDEATALEAALRAINLADASIAQAENEAQAWQNRPPFNQ